ncbi:MAG: hypothetical protein ACI8ZX_001830 [Planctomycetota bacterium]|jgi:hypothetical protein
MIRFFRSIIFFIKFFFVKKDVDVVLYAPQHFNRGKCGENEYFTPIIKSLEVYNLTYLFFDEPDYISDSASNNNHVPFDFIYVIIIFLRRLFSSEMDLITKDQKIGKFLSKTLLRNFDFKNCIVLSQSMLSVFRGVNNNAKIFDLQHGIIHSDKNTYIRDGVPASNISRNNVNLLLYGEGFKNLLTALKDGYYHTSTFVIGTYNKVLNVTPESNKNILVSLQFTADHTSKQNNLLINELEQIIINNPTFYFYLKNHPRFNHEVDLNRFYKFENVKKATSDLYSNFPTCSLHLTSYSTTAFECALLGIPTVFMQCLSDEFSMFKKDYDYPFNYSLLEVFNDYINCSSKVNNWAKSYYIDFNEDKFIKCLLL